MIAPDRIQSHPLPRKMLDISRLKRARKHLSSIFLWLCLLLTCIGTSWFACQYFLVPQARSYTPDWQDAQWIQATDTANTSSPVTYFRYTTDVTAIPDDAFITITANQVFQLYVNGNYIANNTKNFVRGDVLATYMFDIDSLLTVGSNSIGIRIVNVDQNIPQMRANIGTTWGQQTRYYGSSSSWQATGQTALAHPRNAPTPNTWSTSGFDASQWQPAGIVKQPMRAAPLAVNPLVYEQPLPAHWISTDAGREGYFVRHMVLPVGTHEALLRLVATGSTDIFINGRLYMRWNGQVDVPLETINALLDDSREVAPYRNGLLLGVYDISPYVHAGSNTIAIHVLSPGTSTAKVGLETLKSALRVDMIVGAAGAYTNPFASDAGWHASSQPVANWTREQSAAFQWAAPDPVGRPGASQAYYLPDSNTPRSVQIIPPDLLTETILYSMLAVLICWLSMARLIMRHFSISFREALESACLIFLPALALEALLISLSREPLLTRPFPYTGFWASVLVAVVALSALGLWLYLYKRNAWLSLDVEEEASDFASLQAELTAGIQDTAGDTRQERPVSWLRRNWGLLLILLLAIPMACYNLAYEPFWQDELSSYYAARSIMLHGFPAFPSGYLYPKGELFSAILALVMSLFGTTGAIVPRTISVVWYLLSIPLLYFCGQKLFNRRVAWLAAAMLALSPYALLWARQTRMYEQAQLSALLVFFLFYQALQMWNQKRPVYLAVLSLLLAYFSHEENFIILPAVLVCVLLGSREGPYGLPAILHKKHWWSAALVAVTLITSQLLMVFWVNPQIFATDQSRRPQIQISLDNVPYYFHLLFQGGNPITDNVVPWLLTQPWITVNSLLALLGCLLAWARKDRRARYCALFLLVSSCTLIFAFTMQADRYYYPLLPIYYLMGAYAFWRVLEATWRFVRLHLALPAGRPHPELTLALYIVMRGIATLLCISVLILPMLPISNYNLFVSRVLSLPYRHHFADYDDVSQYMQGHLRKGDVVITVAPAVSVLYYVGQVDYYFSIDRSLFLFERNGKLIETTSGASPMLNQSEFQNVLSAHDRIWLITDNGGYQGGVTKNSRFTFPPSDFRRVYEGYGSAIYFRSASG